MPFKSIAQQRAMHAMANRGEIKPSVVHEFDRATNFASLPERASDRGTGAPTPPPPPPKKKRGSL